MAADGAESRGGLRRLRLWLERGRLGRPHCTEQTAEAGRERGVLPRVEACLRFEPWPSLKKRRLTKIPKHFPGRGWLRERSSEEFDTPLSFALCGASVSPSVQHLPPRVVFRII